MNAVEPESKPIAERSRLRRFINRYEVDQAVFFAIVSRGWSFLSGPITMLLIASFFTEQLQDYFYVFWFLLGMQAFFELSMDVVIVNVASHEWASLGFAADGKVTGNQDALDRLASLMRITRRWYRGISVGFLVVIGLGGIAFLGQKDLARSAWLIPWCVTAVVASVQLNLLPALGLLEGCGQLGVINRYRTGQAVAGSLAVWASIAAGAGLWAIVATALVRLSVDARLVFVRYRNYFGSLTERGPAAGLEWRADIWPLQWRLGVQSIVTYFSFNLFTAVMFEFHDEGVAGRMGMTWSILTTVQASAFAWVETRRPLFGGLIVQRQYEQLDRFYFRLTGISMTVLTAGCLAFLAGLLMIRNLDFWITRRLSERLLDPLPAGLLCAAVIVLQLARCQSVYVRAHKRDPFLVPSLIANTLNIVLIWELGRRFGPTGAACGFLFTTVVVITPWWSVIWRRSRSLWHSADEQGAGTSE